MNAAASCGGSAKSPKRAARDYVVQVHVGPLWLNVERSRGTRDFAEDYLAQVIAMGGVSTELRVKSVVARP